MSASNPIDRDLGSLLADLAAPQFPDYIDDVLERAVRGSQRPAWTFPERWLPVNVIARQPLALAPVPWRTVGLLALLVMLIAAGLLVAAGSQRSVPAPFGPAGNGLVAYSANGDIHARDLETGDVAVVVGGPATDFDPTYSRDGTRLAFVRETPDAPNMQTLMIAKADGTDARAVHGPVFPFRWFLSPSGGQVAILTDGAGTTKLSILDLGDASRPTVDLPFAPVGGAWRPPDGRELVLLGQLEDGSFAIHAVSPDGRDVRRLTSAAESDRYWEPFSLTPDGRRLFYGSGLWPFSVHVLDLDTGVDRKFGGALPPPAADPGVGDIHAGTAVLSPDGTRLLFGRYWDERDGTINHQVWMASADGDGEGAVPVGPLHRSRSGHNPFSYAFSPDGRQVLIQMNEVAETWLVDPASGAPTKLEWGVTADIFDWQRTAP